MYNREIQLFLNLCNTVVKCLSLSFKIIQGFYKLSDFSYCLIFKSFSFNAPITSSMWLIFSFGLTLPSPPWSTALGIANLTLQLPRTPRNFTSFAKFQISFYSQFALYLLYVVQCLHYTINMRQTNNDVDPLGWDRS